MNPMQKNNHSVSLVLKSIAFSMMAMAAVVLGIFLHQSYAADINSSNVVMDSLDIIKTPYGGMTLLSMMETQ